MWLDRLSSHSTPSASPPPSANRSFSPASRRPSHLAPTSAPQRPGFTPRSSSLSLVSNDSTASLLASSRNPNGTGPKRPAAVSSTPDPLEVLEKLLGPKGKGLAPSSKAGDGVDTTEESGFELDFAGLSLQDFLEQETPESDLEAVYNMQTIDECMYNPTIFSSCLLAYSNRRTREGKVRRSPSVYTRLR